ncbi:MAG: TonB-dependent receptor [Prolixibacteraceae bacterium]
MTTTDIIKFMGIKKIISLLLFLSISLFSFSQQEATISGLVTDIKTKEPLVGATVMLEGTTTGTVTDFDGVYRLERIKPGTYTIRCSFISYETIIKEKVSIGPKQNLEINFPLKESTVEIEDVKVIGQANRRSENMLLLEQKNSVVATQAIGAQEIARKGVSNAEGAVTKVSGISKQEGVKNVFVRGLGDRFNSTSLNGFPVPSEDPEYKNISLDFFASDVLQAVGVSKVFDAKMSGDVGGADINISPRELTGDVEFGIDASMGINTNTVSKDFMKPDGINALGYANKKDGPSNVTQYAFQNSLDPSKQNLQLDQNYTVEGGKKLLVGASKNPYRFYILGMYATNYNYTDGVVRNTGTTGTLVRDQHYDKYEQNTNHMVMANMDYNFKGQTISYNALYLHSNTQSAGDYFGIYSDVFQEVGTYNDQGLVRRQQVNDNTLLVNQLTYKSDLSDRLSLDAGIAYDLVVGSEPDRRINYLTDLGDDVLRLKLGEGRHQRYFSEIKEHDIVPEIGFSYTLTKGPDHKSILNFGYNGRFSKRSFEATEYNHLRHGQAEDQPTFNRYNYRLDDFFNQEELDNNAFSVRTTLNKYSVDKFINSGYAEVVYEFSEKFTGIAGVRADQVNMTIDHFLYNGGDSGSNDLNEFYILPSLNLRYNLTEKSTFRLGASRTYTLPQDKEISPYRYDGPVWRSQGNPDLLPATNYNFDLKWDYYLSQEEILSLTGFSKYIEDPISRIEVANAGGYLTYDNISDHATIYGAELEIRKNIFKALTEKGKSNKLSAGLNASYLFTDITLKVPPFTNDWSKLEGAAPGIINIDLTHHVSKNDFYLANSLVLNYFSERIYTIGTQGYQDIMEKGVPMLDFVTSARLNKHWELNLKARNLLNPNFRLTREPSGSANSIILSDYKKGVSVSFGIAYDL